jgi:hypothetical protein
MSDLPKNKHTKRLLQQLIRMKRDKDMMMLNVLILNIEE